MASSSFSSFHRLHRHSRRKSLPAMECSDERSGDGAPCTKESILALGSSNGAGEDELMDHLHQVFVTKNPVLCSEVQKNFRDLSQACSVAQSHLKAIESNPLLPPRLQDVHSAGYPLFLTARQFLMMLDASLPGEPFFERKEDGSLKREVQGWRAGHGPVIIIPSLGDENDDDEDPEEEDPNLQPDGDEDEFPDYMNPQKWDPRREVTYEVFAGELWPKIRKKLKYECHPTLVWTEIMSFIKGSMEALITEEGFLSLDDYKSLGKKRAPNFCGDRDKIYKAFGKYRHLQAQRALFDEADLVTNLYRRMKGDMSLDWIIHQFYVDETQDFTQAELCLLIRCCQNPNDMFLTGDTAQTIMRGISFRFEDLKTLFYHARDSMKALGKVTAVEVPRMYQLVHNYRSHAGILRLASSVVELLTRFFPNSFDPLKRDQGLFEGPRPILLESCSFTDLAMLLQGNKRKTSQIEFGAHQAILVANEAARDSLPEELSLGLVLTIFESKGLEFDDILLYNFFKDSQVKLSILLYNL